MVSVAEVSTERKNRAIAMRTRIIGGLLLAGTLAITGCATAQHQTAGETPTTQTLNVSPAGVKEESSWAMPLDPYRLSTPHLNNYAEQLAVKPCVEKNGYAWPVPWQDIDEPAEATINGVGRRLFDTEIAQAWGYHHAAPTSESDMLWEGFLSATRELNTDEAFDTVFDACLDEVRATNPLPNMDDQAFVFGLSFEAATQATADAEVTAAAQRWTSCMVDAGFPGVPATPELMPSPDLIDKFGLAVVDTATDRVAEITPEEVALATVHAKCADTTGYTELLYEAQWALEESAAEANAARLQNIKAEVDRYHEGVLEFVAQYAPPAP